ncbi:hypothetical protein [Streptomyces rubiginosohelvolus]|uniref:hypothetical protein n=1 Tax=Streptomyces rubiginosohelvolus TaxID=67362 RepID=UPI0038177E50
MVAAAGIVPHGDTQACRWVAARHADDHIHLVATLARQDGPPHPRRYPPHAHRRPRLRDSLGPSADVPARPDRAPSPGHGGEGEGEKAARRGLPEAARESLQRTVREAAARATTTNDFLTRLRDAGLRVREHHDENGALDGYAVALPGDRADHGTRPVWFSGRTLAYDLSLPRIRERFHPTVAPADLALAHTRIREAATLLTRAGRTEGAGDVAALGDLLVAAAATAPTAVRDQIRAAAAAFEQASRTPGTRTLHGTARAHFKASAQALEHAPQTARGGGAPAVLNLLIALVEAVEAATAWHRAQHHHAQTRAAAQAAALLREAATLTGAPPPDRPAPPGACRAPYG